VSCRERESGDLRGKRRRGLRESRHGPPDFKTRRRHAMRKRGVVALCSLAVLHMHRPPQLYALLRLPPLICGRHYRTSALPRSPPNGAASAALSGRAVAPPLFLSNMLLPEEGFLQCDRIPSAAYLVPPCAVVLYLKRHLRRNRGIGRG
jgi:hypothetical protein